MQQSISKKKKRKSQECFCQGNWVIELVTGFNTLAKELFLSADPEYAYKITFFNFCLQVRLNLSSKPNWGLHVADQSLKRFKFFLERQKKKSGFRLVEFPRWHSASTCLHQKAWDTPVPPPLWFTIPEHIWSQTGRVGCLLDYVAYELSSVEMLRNPPCKTALKGKGPSSLAAEFQG